MTKSVTIEKGWYRTVGRKFGWLEEHSMEGVGLHRELFNGDKILITVKGKNGAKQHYELDSEVGMEFIKKYKSFEMIGGNKIGFVPRSLLTEVQPTLTPGV